MSIERYIISKKETGQIIGCGRINRKRDQEWINKGDTSTKLGIIQKKLQDNPDLQVLYLPNSIQMPDLRKRKVNNMNTAIVNKTEEDLIKDQKLIDIATKKAEIDRLQKIINAGTRLNQLQAELTLLEQE